MQRTDESRGAYGEDPYGDAGHAYAYGYEYGGSVGTDTGTMSWDSVELAQWTHSEYSTHATGTDPHATGTHPYVAGPYPATTAWDSPHGDVLTVPPPEFDTGAPVPEPETPANESVRPVFVDSSGRRRRRVLRAARLLVIPAGGYVALLISTMLGGPGISSPFVPQPDSTHPTTPRATAPDAPPGTGRSAGTASPTAGQRNSGPAVQKTPGPTDRSAASTAPAATSGPTAAPTRITSPTSTAAPAPISTLTRKGRANGSSHHPVK
ncbi:hypothetical protein [Streptomyces sp. GbtcB7]|uniref:hypothetical protein n=1 Tax=Streptomyces sp. GbtcB7 TaxID=2824752 RepID=UPI001C2FAE15|nr:hypothetical protein [Streptomyces sp. GbtcB7]